VGQWRVGQTLEKVEEGWGDEKEKNPGRRRDIYTQ
jgi:hypothetical protein